MTATNSPPPESSEFDPKRVIEELVKGREVALKLQSLLGSDLDDPHQLVANILGSFVNTISMLNRKPEDSPANPPPTHQDVKPEESEESIKTSSLSLKARRGCHPRRKSSESWVKMSGSLRDDGYHWRKYGQKSILNSKHPRSYFRCTHKFEQGCQATKQVQQLEEEDEDHRRSPLFRTTYYGQHTCKTLSPTQIDFHEVEIDHDHLSTPTSSSSPFLLSFDQSQSQSQSPNSNVTNQNLFHHHQMLVKVEHQLPPSSAASFDHDYLSPSSPSSNLTSFDDILPELNMDMDSMVGVNDYFDDQWQLQFT